MPSWLPPTEPLRAGKLLNPIAAYEQGVGAPAVLLHGQPGDRHDWDDVIVQLRGRVRAVVPDRPGYGKTAGWAGGVAANADAVVALLDRLEIGAATLAGFSWGGAVALDIAARYPDRVNGLVLVASVGGEGSIDDLDRLLGAPVFGPLLSLGGLAVMRAAQVRRLMTRATGRPVDVRPDAWLGSWRSFVVEQRALLEELPGVTRRLGQVRAPTTVMIGTADRLVRPASQESMAAAIDGAEVVRLPGRGHLLTREAPDEVATAIVARAGGA